MFQGACCGNNSAWNLELGRHPTHSGRIADIFSIRRVRASDMRKTTPRLKLESRFGLKWGNLVRRHPIVIVCNGIQSRSRSHLTSCSTFRSSKKYRIPPRFCFLFAISFNSFVMLSGVFSVILEVRVGSCMMLNTDCRHVFDTSQE